MRTLAALLLTALTATAAPPLTWNRPPKNNSGNSTMWLRLIQ